MTIVDIFVHADSTAEAADRARDWAAYNGRTLRFERTFALADGIPLQSFADGWRDMHPGRSVVMAAPALGSGGYRVNAEMG